MCVRGLSVRLLSAGRVRCKNKAGSGPMVACIRGDGTALFKFKV
jgi:hypothetical protein